MKCHKIVKNCHEKPPILNDYWWYCTTMFTNETKPSSLTTKTLTSSIIWCHFKLLNICWLKKLYSIFYQYDDIATFFRSLVPNIHQLRCYELTIAQCFRLSLENRLFSRNMTLSPTYFILLCDWDPISSEMNINAFRRPYRSRNIKFYILAKLFSL